LSWGVTSGAFRPSADFSSFSSAIFSLSAPGSASLRSDLSDATPSPFCAFCKFVSLARVSTSARLFFWARYFASGGGSTSFSLSRSTIFSCALGSGLGIGGSGGTTTSGSGGDMSTAGDAAVTDAACQMATVKFTPKIPTVFVLVDRSGSEFTDATTGTYFTLQAAVLQVIKQLQGTVRFGFGDFVGDHGSSTCKTVFNSVPIALNNYDPISKQYMMDGPLLPYGTKAETPAAG